jgi:hypothetical protein
MPRHPNEGNLIKGRQHSEIFLAFFNQAYFLFEISLDLICQFFNIHYTFSKKKDKPFVTKTIYLKSDATVLDSVTSKGLYLCHINPLAPEFSFKF